MTVNVLEGKAFIFAKKRHGSQRDDNGILYFYAHILHTVSIVKMVTDNPYVITATYLHDLPENTNTTYDEIKEKFGYRVADLVMEVTHEGNKQTGYYFPRLHTLDAMLIKFADRLSNLSRMECWSESRQRHYMKKSVFWKQHNGGEKS